MRSDPSGKKPSYTVVDRRFSAIEETGKSLDEADSKGNKEPAYVEQLKRELEEKDRLLRGCVAEFKESRRELDEAQARIRRDVAKEVERGRRAVITELLDVVDNLERAIEAGAQAGEKGQLAQGVTLVRDLFLTKLDGLGVRRIEALGEAFDPIRHEALTVVPAGSPGEDGRIVGVIRHGYHIGEDTLRPASVAVARLGR
ncbi:MAG: nucleotide exchange factor GrpE [Deltaproteobacteria bacterium]|nr:nucleotide exchange factor GrpE [Deltaproteobacteria bacterium]